MEVNSFDGINSINCTLIDTNIRTVKSVKENTVEARWCEGALT